MKESNMIIVTVLGTDRVGIIAEVSSILAQANANIVDISQTIMHDLFTMMMMVDIGEASLPFSEIKNRLEDKGNEMGLQITAQHEDVFRFMHRI